MASPAVALAIGILGDFISFLVFLSPAPTFVRILKRKSTQGFSSVPYVVALFSCMLWVFYSFLKTKSSAGYILIIINASGCFIQTIYIILFFIYADNKVDIFKLVSLLIVGAYPLIALLTLLLAEGDERLKVVGWICTTFSVSVFVAPLTIIRQVIRTKSVEFMPFNLSCFLTLSAVVWFIYGWLIKDLYVALPNVLGMGFGSLQMLLYARYRSSKKAAMIVGEGSKMSSSTTTTDQNGSKVVNVKLSPTSSEEVDGTEDEGAKEMALPVVADGHGEVVIVVAAA